MILFWFGLLRDSTNFERLFQMPDLENTTQFSLHLTKAIFLLETIRNLRQRTVNEFMLLFCIFIRILLHQNQPKKQSPKVFYKKRCSKKLSKNYRKTPKLEPPAQVFSREFCEIFKNTFLTEHQRVIASETTSSNIIQLEKFRSK